MTSEKNEDLKTKHKEQTPMIERWKEPGLEILHLCRKPKPKKLNK